MNLFGKTWQIALGGIVVAEFLSLCGHATPWINTFGFFVTAFFVFAISIYKLEWGFLALVVELLIGSKGYLFYFDINEKTISIRIALWLIIMLVWFAKTIWASLKNKRIILNWQKSSNFFYFLAFFAFVLFALVNGQLHHNSLSNIFFDFNGWLYLALIFPAYDLIVAKKENIIPDLLQIFSAAILWIVFKTSILIFLFSHDIGDIIFVIYRWIRTTGVGEITLIQGGFYRIFFQSHIYLLAAFLFLLIVLSKDYLLEKIKIKRFSKKQNFLLFYLIFTAIFSINLINFSRSNWLGLVTATFLLLFIVLVSKNWQQLFKVTWILLSSAILSALFIIALVNFPLFNPIGGFNTAELLSKRAATFSNEAGVSSRWSLLLPLWQEIAKEPLLGQGFGATVTYKTSDPRILENNPSGLYTTYAFEWGWLDIWLKLGFAGSLVYLILLFKIYFVDVYRIIKTNVKKTFDIFDDINSVVAIGLSLGMVALMIVNTFSPYLNHPLGFGYLVISSVIIERIKNSASSLS